MGKPLSITLPPRVLEIAERRAKATGQTVYEICRTALICALVEGEYR